MAAKKREIYARFGVQLITNERSFVAGPDAMGVYAFCVMWTRKEQRDGFVPELVALTAWGGEKRDNAKRLERLITCGYLERTDGGFRVSKYDEHNDTVSDIEAAREAARTRKGKSRGGHMSGHGDVTRDIRVSHAEVPISISISDSGSDLSADQNNLSGGSKGPPPFFVAAAATAEGAVGRPVDHLDARFVEYEASRDRKRWPMSHKDAAGWLTTVMRAEGREAKAKTSTPRGAEATKQPYDENAPWMKLPEVG